MHRILAGSMPLNQYYVLKVTPSFIMDLGSQKNAISYVLRLAVNGSRDKVLWRAGEPGSAELRAAFAALASELGSDGQCEDIARKLAAGRVMLTVLRDLIRLEEEQEIRMFAVDGASAQIYRVIRHINKHYQEELDAGSCSAMVNLSYSYFSRSFKRITGRSFKEYLNEVRINHAQELLMTTDKSVMQVALECGYNNVSYFIMLYKTMKGTTPLGSRKAAGAFGKDGEK